MKKGSSKTKEAKLKDIDKLAKTFWDTEKKLREMLEELPDYGEECNCDKREIIVLIHYGEWEEIEQVCLNCGGICSP